MTMTEATVESLVALLAEAQATIVRLDEYADAQKGEHERLMRAYAALEAESAAKDALIAEAVTKAREESALLVEQAAGELRTTAEPSRPLVRAVRVWAESVANRIRAGKT